MFIIGKENTTQRKAAVLTALFSLLTVISAAISVTLENDIKKVSLPFFGLVAISIIILYIVLIVTINLINAIYIYIYGEEKKLKEITTLIQLQELRTFSVLSLVERITHLTGMLLFMLGFFIAVNLFVSYIQEGTNKLSDISSWLTISAFGFGLVQLMESVAKNRLQSKLQEIQFKELIEKIK